MRILREAAHAAAVVAVLLLTPAAAAAQQFNAPPAPADAFARRGWHVEFAVHGAIETWNYNTSHEDLLGIVPGITYGLRDGLLLTAAGPLYYIDQRGVDTYLMGVNFGLRRRVYRARRTSAFVEFQVGISDAETFTPPRGTRFNYLALGGAGATFRVRRGLDLIGSLRWIHISNNGLAGRSRNPDIEAVGPQIGLLLGF